MTVFVVLTSAQYMPSTDGVVRAPHVIDIGRADLVLTATKQVDGDDDDDMAGDIHQTAPRPDGG
jgi:hypothetical protein